MNWLRRNHQSNDNDKHKDYLREDKADTHRIKQSAAFHASGTIFSESVPPPDDIKAVIFDLGGVLFDKSATQAMLKLSKATLLKFMWHGHNPLSLRRVFFHTLRLMQPYPHETSVFPTYEGDVMPLILSDWMVNKRPSVEILNDVLTFIDSSDTLSDIQKALLRQITQLTFDPAQVADVMAPLRGCQFVERIKQKNEDIQLCLLSNFNREAFCEIKRRNSPIFDLFDHQIVSGEVGMMKPDENIYELALEKLDVLPRHCVYIDDAPENIATGQKLGFTSIICNDFVKVEQQLQLLQLI